MEPFAKKLLHIFLLECTNTERGIERHFQTLQCLYKLLKVFNSGTFIELDQSLDNLYASVQLHISNFAVLGMSMTKNTIDTFVFLLHTCSYIFRPVPVHNKNIKMDLLFAWLAPNFSWTLMRALGIKSKICKVRGEKCEM